MGARSFCQEKDALVKALRKHPCAFAQQTGNSSCAQFSLTHCFDFSVPCSQMECRVQKRAHPDLNQGPADLQSAALTTELCTQLQRGPCHPRDRVYGTHFSSHRLRVLKWALCSLDDFQQRRRGFGASSLASIGRERESVCVCFCCTKTEFQDGERLFTVVCPAVDVNACVRIVVGQWKSHGASLSWEGDSRVSSSTKQKTTKGGGVHNAHKKKRLLDLRLAAAQRKFLFLKSKPLSEER